MKRGSIKPTKRLAIYAAVLLVYACLGASSAMVRAGSAVKSAHDHSADVATAWFDLQSQLVRTTPGYTPPVAARAYGYSGVTLYEAVVAGIPDYQSLVGQLNELTELPQPEVDVALHWGAVANSALARITRLLYSTASAENLAAMDDLYNAFVAEYEDEVDAGVMEQSVTYGQQVADAVYDWSMTDGGYDGHSTNFPTDYVPPAGDGLWLPTPRLSGEPQSSMQPYWGNNRPFVLESGATCLPPAPPQYSQAETSDFYREALEVYEVSQLLSEERRDIALFWADDPGLTATPPGHLIAILTQILDENGASLAFAAEAYARVGIAVSDAFIGCWHAKYVYNLVRPVTYIRAEIDESWMPIINTPPFPEYPSGHSVQSAAGAAVLSALFGDAYTFTDHTHDDLNLQPRRFTSFTSMAQEAALSRMYAGIHYRSAIEQGLMQGQCIGEQINALNFRRPG